MAEKPNYLLFIYLLLHNDDDISEFEMDDLETRLQEMWLNETNDEEDIVY